MGQNAEIDSLELRIEASSKEAERGLDALIDTLGRLKTATAGGCGLKSIVDPVEKLGKSGDADKKLSGIGDAVNKLSGMSAVKLASLSMGLKSLSKVSDLKLSSSIATQISAIGTAVANQAGADYSKLGELAKALKPLTSVGESKYGSVLNQMKKLPEVLYALEQLDLTAFAAKIREVADAMKPLADEMQKVANGFSAMPAKIQSYIQANNGIPKANLLSEFSFRKLFRRIIATGYGLVRTAKGIAQLIDKYNEYTENLNLFTVSMGEYADSALQYANTVSEVMGIDTSDWIRAQGVFMTMATGFGVAGDRASTMSQQLTQLGYDIASYYNTSVEEAMQRLQSGLAGELEPLRRLGYDLSQAKLEATALSLGIDKAVSSMTQAEKAELRYYAIMNQVKQVQGDMADTLDHTANQMRVMKAQFEMAARAVGELFIPTLKKMLPWAIAVAKTIQFVATSLAGLFGVTGEDIEDAMSRANSGASGVSASLEEATDNAGKLKKQLLGIDELNVMSDASGSGSDAEVSGGGFSFDLPTYEFLSEEVNTRVNEIVETMKEWLGITGEIDSWAELFETRLGRILIGAGLIGVAIAAWKIGNGVAKVLGLLGIGKTKAVGDVGEAGTEVSKASTKLKTLAKNLGLGVAIIAEVAAAAIIVVGAVAILGWELEQVAIAWEPVIANAGTVIIAMGLGVSLLAGIGYITNELGKHGKTMITNLALGIAILAEVGVATGLFIAEVWAIGWGLEQVGIAWEPVIANGDTILTAMGIGTGILVAVGVATALLGTLGGAVCGQIGIGIAILVELGAAALLFIAEIWAIGKGLDEIGKAWGPVLDNGEEIAEAIAIGTGLLVGIGVVTAALGVATVASVGLLPVAIALGTGLLGELTWAFIEFTNNLIKVGNQLKDKLHPCLKKVKEILPPLSENMEEFTSFMSDFATKVVEFTKANAISSIASTVDKIVDFFTADPIDSLAKEIKEQYNQMTKLVDRLKEIVPVVQDADRLMGEFNSTMDKLKAKMGVDGKASGTISYIITVGVALAKSGWKSIDDWIGNLSTTLKIKLPHVSVSWAYAGEGEGAVKYPKFGVDYYAQGGFPTEGQLFWANENGAGPELVGSIGNRSAVVNNDQIVSAVAQGVYQAVVQANAQSGNQTVEAKVNEKVLFEVIMNRNRQETMRKGYNPLMGGV